MTNDKPRILITGANGFVGSRLCRKFLDQGYHVVAGVRKTSDLSLLKELEIEYRYGDVTAPDTLPDMIKDTDYIVHNAGLIKARKPESFFEVNEKGTHDLFEAIANHNRQIKKAIYISSQAAAGPVIDGRPVTESDPPHPITTYGASKLAGEQEALSFADKFHVISLRPPGVYGPGDKEIFTFFQTVNRRIKPLIGDIHRKLQVIHVDDLSQAVRLAVQGNTNSGQSYFVAENRAYTLHEMVTILSRVSGKRGVPLRLPAFLFKLIAVVSESSFRLVGAAPMLTLEKARELLESWELSTDKARDSFGFDSQIPFETGARETFAWYRENGWLK